MVGHINLLQLSPFMSQLEINYLLFIPLKAVKSRLQTAEFETHLMTIWGHRHNVDRHNNVITF